MATSFCAGGRRRCGLCVRRLSFVQEQAAFASIGEHLGIGKTILAHPFAIRSYLTKASNLQVKSDLACHSALFSCPALQTECDIAIFIDGGLPTEFQTATESLQRGTRRADSLIGCRRFTVELILHPDPDKERAAALCDRLPHADGGS